MIFDKLFENKIRNKLMKTLEKHGSGVFNYEEREKITNTTIKVNKFLSTMITSAFLIWFLSRYIHNKLGYETTMIIIVTIIMLLISQKK